MTKHTPGPWKLTHMFARSEKEWGTCVCELPPSDINPDGGDLCIAVKTDTKLGDEQADYQLMAAAPELLTACQALLESAKLATAYFIDFAQELNDKAIAQAEAAIAKATGESEEKKKTEQ